MDGTGASGGHRSLVSNERVVAIFRDSHEDTIADFSHPTDDLVFFGFGHVTADHLPALDFGLVDPVADIGFGVVEQFPRIDKAGLLLADFEAVGMGQDFAVWGEGGRVDGPESKRRLMS